MQTAPRGCAPHDRSRRHCTRSSRTRHRVDWSRRSRSSTSTLSGATPPTWNAAPRASRSAWPASRCAAARCRSGCSRGPASGDARVHLPEALWLAEQGSRTSSSPIRPPIATRCASSRDHRRGGLGARCRYGRSLAQLDLIDAALTVPLPLDILRHRRLVRRRLAPRATSAWTLDAGLWLLVGACRIGAKRSPAHTPEQAAALAREIVTRERRASSSG